VTGEQALGLRRSAPLALKMGLNLIQEGLPPCTSWERAAIQGCIGIDAAG